MVTLKNIRQVYLDGKKYTIADSYRLIDGNLYYSGGVTGVQTCALPICFPVTIRLFISCHSNKLDEYFLKLPFYNPHFINYLKPFTNFDFW